MVQRVTRLDYCQFLLSSQINYTLTYFADHHHEGFSHDLINQYLRQEKMTPRLLWDNVEDDIVYSAKGYVLFDDTIVDKNYSHCIELVRRQWSGNAKSVIKGIGVVTCVYVNPELDDFWAVDYRLYAPQDDGKSKLDHVEDMLMNLVYQKELPFITVLMDTWYAARKLMLTIERLEKIYYCPIKSNRLVDETDGEQTHRRVDSLLWTEAEQQQGKLIHIKSFPKGHRVKLFRLVLSTQRTDFVVTNDLSQDSTDAVQQVSDIRWKIEQFHRETKQVTGIEQCQCRKARIQRNHIACAMLVWARLKQVARQTQQTIYQVKFGLLSDYMIAQLKNPSIQMKITT
jgi:hypothetical protein